MIALLISYLFVGIGLLYISEFKPGTGLLARFLVMFLWPLVLLAIWNSYLKGIDSTSKRKVRSYGKEH